MKFLQSNGHGPLWVRFQRWRALRMLSRITKLEAQGRELYAKAMALLDRTGGS